MYTPLLPVIQTANQSATGRKFTDLLKVPKSVDLEMGDYSGWARINQRNIFKGLGFSSSKKSEELKGLILGKISLGGFRDKGDHVKKHKPPLGAENDP